MGTPTSERVSDADPPKAGDGAASGAVGRPAGVDSNGEGFLLVDIDRFQGPLDLLLHLIRQQDIDVFDIPIARITRQFLVAIQGIEASALESAGEFLEMAATLIRIKAQMLLPRTGLDEDEDPRAELVRRLLEYELVREVSGRLRVSEAERSRRFGKGFIPPRVKLEVAEQPLETDWEAVLEAALEVTMPDPLLFEHQVRLRPVAMEEKVDLILDSLRKSTKVRFSDLVRPWVERIHGVMTFLAGLELGRRRVVRLRQGEPFSELWIYRGENVDEDGSATDPGPEEAS